MALPVTLSPPAASADTQMQEAQPVRLYPVKRLRDAMKSVDDARQQLYARVVQEVCQVILKDVLPYIRTQGFVQLDVQFKNATPHFYPVYYPRVIANLESLGVILMDKRLEAALRQTIKPFSLRISHSGLEDMPLRRLNVLTMMVTDCRMRTILDKHGNASKTVINPDEIHQEGINDIQTELHKAEQHYQNLPVDENKVDDAIQSIFSESNPNSPYNRFLTAVGNLELADKLFSDHCFRVAFNCKSEALDFDKRLTSQQKSLIGNVSGLRMDEIALFFKKTIHPERLFVCKTVKFSTSEEVLLYDDGASGHSEDCVSVLAEYHMDTLPEITGERKP